jgi:hypothetical protein
LNGIILLVQYEQFVILFPSFAFLNFSKVMMYAHGSEYQGHVFMEHNTIQFGRWVLTFRNYLLASFLFLRVPSRCAQIISSMTGGISSQAQHLNCNV